MSASTLRGPFALTDGQVDQQVAHTSAGAYALNRSGSTIKLDEVVDLVRGGKPEMLLMSRRTRRTLSQLSRASGSGVVEHDRDEFGRMVAFYDGIPIGVNDYISDAETVGTSTDCSTIYALQFGEGAVAGLTAPGGLTIERVGALETKDATRVRVKWYVSVALFNELKLAKLIGVRP